MNTAKTGRLHMTVGVAMDTTDLSMDLSADLRMAKAALLYADRVTLVSLKSFFVLGMLTARDSSAETFYDMMEELLPVLLDDKTQVAQVSEFLRLYRTIAQHPSPTVEQIALKAIFDQAVGSDFIDKLRTTLDTILVNAGAEDLLRARDTGLIEIHEFSSAFRLADMHESRVGGEWLDAVIHEFVRHISEAVRNGKTYPLFDDQTGSLVRAGIKEGIITITDAGVTRGKHGSLATNLIERLPLFDHATIDEILDIRRELDRYLVRFRAAIIGYADTIKSAAWDADFEIEAEQVFRRDVAPAVVALEEAVKANRYLMQLLHRLATKSLALPGGLAVGLSELSQLPSIISHAVLSGAGLSAALSMGKATVATTEEWHKQKKVNEQNQLFFYYQANQQLQKKHGKT